MYKIKSNCAKRVYPGTYMPYGNSKITKKWSRVNQIFDKVGKLIPFYGTEYLHSTH